MSKKRTNFNAMLRCWLLRMFKHPKFDELMHWSCRTFNLGKCVGNKVCAGTEREEINSSTADTENTHVETNNGTDSTTED